MALRKGTAPTVYIVDYPFKVYVVDYPFKVDIVDYPFKVLTIPLEFI